MIASTSLAVVLHDLAVIVDVLNQPRNICLNPMTGCITALLIRGRENNKDSFRMPHDLIDF